MERKTAVRQITFEGGLVPSPALFEGERLLGTIEAGLWDIGLIGFLLKYQSERVKKFCWSGVRPHSQFTKAGNADNCRAKSNTGRDDE